MRKKVHILVMGQAAGWGGKIESALCDDVPHAVTKVAGTEKEFSQAIEKFMPDGIVADVQFPRADGMAVLELVRDLAPGTPVIFVTDREGEEAAVALMKAGAADCVPKDRPGSFGPAVEDALKEAPAATAPAAKEPEISESAYQKIATNVPGLVYQFFMTPDRYMSFSFVSESCRRIFGVDRETVERDANALMGLMNSEDREWFYHSVSESARQLMPSRWEGRITVAGEERWFRAVSRPERLSGGNTLWNGMLIDITTRKRIEDALQQAYSELKQIFNNAASGMCIMNRDMDIVRVNDTFLRMLCLRRDNVIIKKCHEVLANELCHREGCPVQRVLRGDEHAEGEITTELADGTKAAFLVAAVPLLDVGGKVAGVVQSFKDITERKKVEESQRLARLGELIANVAHELNNPVQIIYGRTEVAQMKNAGGKDIKEDLDMIKDQCESAREMIERLLTFSKPSRGARKKVNINASIELVTGLIEKSFSHGNIKIEKVLAGSLPEIEIGEKQMQEVFMNLLKNAADAMPGGGIVTVSTSREGKSIRVDVTDKGCGIPDENMRRIFDPFFTTKEKGTGLGLSVCFGIVKAHGGSLTYKTEEGKGTTATVRLPVK